MNDPTLRKVTTYVHFKLEKEVFLKSQNPKRGKGEERKKRKKYVIIYQLILISKFIAVVGRRDRNFQTILKN